MRTSRVFMSTLCILTVLLCGLASCTGTPSSPALNTTATTTTVAYTAPPTTTQPVDTPKYSIEEMTAMLWNKLPNDLPPGFQKSQFQQSSSNATYISNGKWKYQVTGQTRQTELLPTNTYEKTPDYWVEERSQQVLTRNLSLTSDYFDNSGTLSLQPVQVVSENTTIEVLSQSVVIAKKLRLNWIAGTTTGYDLRVEGAVTNTGIVALENVVFEVTTYDYAGKLQRTDKLTLSPSKIEVGKLAGFCLIVPGANIKQGPNGKWGYYDYRFLTSNDKTITLQK